MDSSAPDFTTALKAAGVEFIPGNGGEAGVRLRRSVVVRTARAACDRKQLP